METKNRNNEQEDRGRTFLPYIQGTTDKIAKVLKKKKIKTIFCPPNSLRNLLDKAKDPINPKLRKGVYSFPCSCEDVYIGETGRSIQTRLKEHCADVTHGRIKKSAIAEHSSKTNHHVCIEEARVLAIEENYNKRRIREAIEIEKHPRNFNRDDGLTLCDSWKPIIHSLQNIKIIR